MSADRPERKTRGFDLSGNILAGMTAGAWFRLLIDNRFSIDRGYRGRAALITLLSLSNSAFAAVEQVRFGRRIAATPVDPAPVFILGHWRNGTSHLHHVLSRDASFAFSDNYQTLNPYAFLSPWIRGLKETLSHRLGLVPERRPMDNMPISFALPQEDEMAMFLMTTHSPSGGLVFPRSHARYDRYVSFDGVAEPVVARWRTRFHWYLKKLSYGHDRCLLLKSPAHTARIPMMLEMFPKARFVHISRNPYETFQSMMHLYETFGSRIRLQQMDRSAIESFVLQRYREMYARYLADRSRIPAGNLYEMRYEDFIDNSMVELERLYEALELGPLEGIRERFGQYLESIRGYQTNRFASLDESLRSRIYTEWKRCFEEWGYER